MCAYIELGQFIPDPWDGDTDLDPPDDAHHPGSYLGMVPGGKTPTEVSLIIFK